MKTQEGLSKLKLQFCPLNGVVVPAAAAFPLPLLPLPPPLAAPGSTPPPPLLAPRPVTPVPFAAPMRRAGAGTSLAAATTAAATLGPVRAGLALSARDAENCYMKLKYHAEYAYKTGISRFYSSISFTTSSRSTASGVEATYSKKSSSVLTPPIHFTPDFGMQ